MNKSLLIISLPKSASTALQASCSLGLRGHNFKSTGELLNNGYAGGLDIPQYAREKHYGKIKKCLLKHNKNFIIRDVIQTPFIWKNVDFLKEHFNILYIRRPVKEIMLCSKLSGWKTPLSRYKKHRMKLDEIAEDEVLTRLDYYDYVLYDQDVLVQILRKWYPKTKPFIYIALSFARKRSATFEKLKNAGIRRKRR